MSNCQFWPLLKVGSAANNFSLNSKQVLPIMNTEERNSGILNELFVLAEKAISGGERPFAALLSLNDKVVRTSIDRVFKDSDPTAHAETVVIREHCRHSGALHLRGHVLYTICEPCVMCCGSIHWAKLDGIVYCVSQESLQKLTGGAAKPSCRSLLPLGRRSIRIVGPVRELQALALFEKYDFRANSV